MDQRGQPDSSRLYHRTQDSRFAQQDWDVNYLPPDPRDRGRHWGHPDPRYLAPFTPPPVRPEWLHYNSQQYGYGWQEHQRPPSRHGSDFPPHNHWDYRDDRYYYSYFRGQQAQPGGGQWSPQGTRRTEYHEKPLTQGGAGDLHTEEYRSEQVQDWSQRYLNNSGDRPSTDAEESFSYPPGTLQSSKTSGLSSSSYELSQYMNGVDLGDPDPRPAATSGGERGAEQLISAPLKYSVPHAVVSFGPAGQLVQLTPRLSAQDSVCHLQIHSVEVILSETEEQQEMRNFPGPLTREDLHKVDAIEFAQQKAGACVRDVTLQDRSSAALLWNLLILLCRQNGQVVGSDIAELLMQDSHSEERGGSDGPSLIDFSEPATVVAPPANGDDLLTGDLSSFSCETPEKALQSYTDLLLAGRKKEALESAMTSGLWGHALFLASKMGSRSYTTVLNRFTSQLAASDPVQTLFQLLSGRIPAVATCCGNEKSGDWRPHLAVMLSNETENAAVRQKAITTMGDSLASRGLTHAAHVCYLTAGVPFGAFTQKAERLVLLSSSHRQPFGHFATISAIQCTELYEYCLTLGGKCVTLPSFQVYKLLYACRLLDCGLSSQAFHYCEVVGRALLRQTEPDFVLTGEVVKLSDRLRCSEAQYSETGFSGSLLEPEWLRHLRARHQSLQTGSYEWTETFELPAGRSGLAYKEVCSESDLDDLSSHTRGTELEPFCSRASEDREWLDDPGEMTAQNWSPTAPPSMPAPVLYSPPGPDVAPGQDFSYHSTDSVEARGSQQHCPPSNVSATAEEFTFGTEKMLDINIAQQNQQVIPSAVEGSEETTSKETKTGWFRGWFKSKPNSSQKEKLEQEGPAQTDPPPPPAGLYPPPAPAALPPGTFPPPLSAAGINPFSRKAGQQLG
ncbi:protein transport protein Sec16B isoform X2 [Austrofundulus limnaeus]|uniref:Protein transport protein sec16 n=1 Tax=Austrofundulus limnaeus TaxID=52670 RepID=A0A2I4CHR5_AUSLI|nr:PREDICTED: protein transport protein Sec16B isoform X2 [Austrofundulus limnaeus]